MPLSDSKDSASDAFSASGSFLSYIGNSHSWSDESTSTTTTVNNENFFDEVINNITSMLNIPYAIGSGDDHDDDTCTNGSEGDDTAILSSLHNKKKKVKAGKVGNVSDDVLNKAIAKMNITDTTILSADTDRDSLSVRSSEVGSSNSSSSYSYSFDSYDGLKRKTTVTDLDEYLDINGDAKVEYNSPMAQLYRAIDTKSWGAAARWLKSDNDMVKCWVYRKSDVTNEIMWMFLPLHAACFSGAPRGLVKELIRVNPQSTSIVAPGDKLPIHIACETGASPDVVSCLVKAYPEALYHVDETGNTPLQLCVFSMSGKNRSKVMKILINSAAGKKNKFRNFMSRGGNKKSISSTNCQEMDI